MFELGICRRTEVLLSTFYTTVLCDIIVELHHAIAHTYIVKLYCQMQLRSIHRPEITSTGLFKRIVLVINLRLL